MVNQVREVAWSLIHTRIYSIFLHLAVTRENLVSPVTRLIIRLRASTSLRILVTYKL